MKDHRSTHAKVSKEPDNSNFEAGTALENLRAEIVDIEALTTKASEQARASLRFADVQVAALTAQAEARRKADAG